MARVLAATLGLAALSLPGAAAEHHEVNPADSFSFTLRYHGRYPERFAAARVFPEQVCSSFAATCVDIKVNECTRSPPDMRVPYTWQVNWGERGSTHSPPRESGSGSYVLLAWQKFRHEGRGDTRRLTLWSGCDSRCSDCRHSTGLATVLHELPTCTATQDGGVFSLMLNGTRWDTHANCWDSLAMYDEVMATNSGMQVLFRCATFSIIGVLACVVLSLLFGYQCRKKAREERHREVIVERFSEQAITYPHIVGKAEIEQAFPATSTSSLAQCVICLVPIEKEDACRRLQCGHEFHASCILSWWTFRPRLVLECPICKQQQQVSRDKCDRPAGNLQPDAQTTQAPQPERPVETPEPLQILELPQPPNPEAAPATVPGALGSPTSSRPATANSS